MTTSTIKKLNLYLIKPSKYDDDGYVIRYWKGVLPSNTLACLYGLTEDVRRREVLGPDLKWKITNIDETVQRVNIRKIVRQSKKKSAKTIVCLVGVQSNQFPRASDLAMQFRAEGIDVLIGGFHVSGVIAMFSKLPAELTTLMDAGVTLVAGEVEGRWELILQDALNGSLKPLYNFLNCPPELAHTPLPKIPENLVNRYTVRQFGTLDCGRGCPFKCSFCTVINVQGRVMRFRPAEDIINLIRENYRRHKISFYFFTDDNFSRNRNWREIFDRIIMLRKKENILVTFMMQVDTQAYRIPGFVEMAAEAGCSQVFIGLESLNEANLVAADKKQNKVQNFKEMVDLYQSLGICVHLAYIIGFPHDTEESVAQNMVTLRQLGARHASFFMLTPLPGSVDHKLKLSQGIPVDADLNNYDSFHETFRHEKLNTGWKRAYENAWSTFYSVNNILNTLKAAPRGLYWQLFLNFVWYKNAIQVELGHPMVHGFIRLKHRDERRSTFPRETLPAYFWRRANDILRTLKLSFKLVVEMEEIWLASRQRSKLEERVVVQLENIKARTSEWRKLRVSELQALYREAAVTLKSQRIAERFHIPSRFRLWIDKKMIHWSPLTYTRRDITRLWTIQLTRLRYGRKKISTIYRISLLALRETFLFAKLVVSILHGLSEGSYQNIKNRNTSR